jgi:hypothetical protein
MALHLCCTASEPPASCVSRASSCDLVVPRRRRRIYIEPPHLKPRLRSSVTLARPPISVRAHRVVHMQVTYILHNAAQHSTARHVQGWSGNAQFILGSSMSPRPPPSILLLDTEDLQSSTSSTESRKSGRKQQFSARTKHRITADSKHEKYIPPPSS